MASYFEKITEPFLVQAYIILCAVSFILSLSIILTARYFFSRRLEQDEKAVQSAHIGFVPRVGGLAIYFSLLSFSVSLNSGFLDPTFLPDLQTDKMYWLTLSAMPIFLIGAAEDLGFNMSPKLRLLASAISGSLVVFWFEVWVSRVGIPLVDLFLSTAPFGIAFTIFATTGVVNAFNLVDGLNGLAGYLTLSSVIALSILAFNNSSPDILRFLFLLAASVVGFFVLNFPFGKIFLGDAGAYTLGHLLVWSSILLFNFHYEISSFSILLIFFWPVADTLLSIWRRLRQKRRADHPDRLHFHQLVMRFLEIRFFGKSKKGIVNPLSTLILIPLISLPQALGVIFWDNFNATVWATLFVGLVFLATYFIGIRLAKTSRIVGR